MIIERPKYMKQLREAEGTRDIKLLTGIRGCGKSTLLRIFAEELRTQTPATNLIRLDYSGQDVDPPRTAAGLFRYVVNAYEPETKNILMIHEVPVCFKFAEALKALQASEQFDIYATSSNGSLCAGEQGALLREQIRQIMVWPFSLREHMDYWHLEDVDVALDRYVKEGGMPGSFAYGTNRSRARYLRDAWRTLLDRDVKTLNAVRSENLLNAVTECLLSSPGSVTSPRSIEKTLRSAGPQVSNKTVGSYLQHLTGAFAFCEVCRYDVPKKRRLASGSKLYLTDPSFRQAVLDTEDADPGWIRGNLVVVELLRQGWEVRAGRRGDQETGFVAILGGEMMYVKVCEDISGPQLLEREIRPFLTLKDRWPCLLLAQTHQPPYMKDGIQIQDLAGWLAGS